MRGGDMTTLVIHAILGVIVVVAIIRLEPRHLLPRFGFGS